MPLLTNFLHPSQFAFCRVVLVVTCLVFTPALLAQDWPAFRGADLTGSVNVSGVLSTGSNVDLKVRWKVALGSGYSSVVIAGDKVVTCYCNATSDLAVCLDKKDGSILWSREIGPAFKGENGSFDGPIATPVIHQDKVVALDPGGKLVCFNLQDGFEIWSMHLADDLGARKPLYGFATSPIMVGDTLVLQAGAPDKALIGIDPANGEIRWSVGDDQIDSQTPLVTELLGRQMIVASGGKKVIIVDPANGTLLGEFEHQGGNGSALMPVPIGDNRLLLTLDDTYSKAVQVRPGNQDKVEISESWQNRSIKNTYNVPAAWGQNLFAYSTRILTCVDPADGKARWKSRAPGDGFLIVVDGHIIINTKQGSLHVAKADGQSYQEVAKLNLFDDLCWSLPSYSDNAIFCRNLKEIACVDIVATEFASDAAEADASLMSKDFRDFRDSVIDAENEQASQQLVQEFMAAQKDFPIVQDGIAHFIYQGSGTDVAVASDIFGARQEKKMTRLTGTDLFYYTVRLEKDQRVNYMFLVDYVPQPDPRNTRRVTSSMYAGEMEFAMRLRNEKPLEFSWFGMSEWQQPTYLNALTKSEKDEQPKLAGQLITEKFDSETIPSGLNCEIYLPPGYQDSTDTRYRTFYLFATPGGRQLGQVDQAADQLFQQQKSGLAPAILVFVNIPPLPNANQACVEELIPAIDKKYRTIDSRESRTTVGFGFAASSAIGLAVEYPDTFGASAVYSPLLFGAALTQVESGLTKLKQPMKIHVDWGRYDMFNPHENWDIRTISKQVAEACQKSGSVKFSGGMVNDTTDWSSWRNRYKAFLELGQ